MCQNAEGFIYAVAINGVTGKTGNYRDDLDKHLANLEAVADIPVLTGFGVSTKLISSVLIRCQMALLSELKLFEILHGGKADDVAAFVTYGSNYQNKENHSIGGFYDI